MTARLTMLLVLAVGIAALATGCGGGDDDSAASADATTVATSSLNKAQYVKRANAICQRGRTRFLNYLSQQVTLPKAIKVSIVPAYEEIISGIRDLGAPKGDEAQIELFLSSMQQGADTLLENAPSVKALPELETPFRDSAKLARKYGIRLCSFSFA